MLEITKECYENHIMILQCRYSQLGVEVSKSLKYGKCNIDKLVNLLKLVNKYIKILYSYDITDDTYNCLKWEQICGIINNSYELTCDYKTNINEYIK